MRKQEAFPLRSDFVVSVAANVIRLKKEGHGNYYISRVLEAVARKHVGKERAYLLKTAERLSPSIVGIEKKQKNYKEVYA